MWRPRGRHPVPPPIAALRKGSPCDTPHASGGIQLCDQIGAPVRGSSSCVLGTPNNRPGISRTRQGKHPRGLLKIVHNGVTPYYLASIDRRVTSAGRGWAFVAADTRAERSAPRGGSEFRNHPAERPLRFLSGANCSQSYIEGRRHADRGCVFLTVRTQTGASRRLAHGFRPFAKTMKDNRNVRSSPS